MIIKSGEQVIRVKEMANGNELLDGSLRNGMRLELAQGITSEQITALLENPWTVENENGDVIETQEGWNTLAFHSLTLYRMDESERAVREAESKVVKMQKGINTVAEAFADNPAVIEVITSVFPGTTIAAANKEA